MNLLALLIGIILEYTATHLFHLRAPRFAQKYLPFWFRFIGSNRVANALVVALLILVCVLPILIVDCYLSESNILFHFLFAILVLFFSFGPHDLVTDVEEYQNALDEVGDSAEKQARLIKAALPLTEIRHQSQQEACSRTVTEGILAQGNNRFFAVIFWFLVLGPTGAALFRVTNSLRSISYRFSQSGDDANTESADTTVANKINNDLRQWQGVLGWIPARLTALSYVLAGHFDSAMQALRSIETQEGDDMFEKNQAVIRQTGTASLQTPDALSLANPEVARECTTEALRLVKRSLILWTAIIAILTLWGTVH